MGMGSLGAVMAAEAAKQQQQAAAAARRDRVAQARAMLEQTLLDYAGWTQLEDWARASIDAMINGGDVDIAALSDKIDRWKLQQQQPQNGGENV